MQEGKPITFPCQALSIKHQGLPTYGEELIDLSLAVIKCRQHVHLFHFIIKIDHFNLKYLRTQTSSQREGLAELLELSYEIQYGKTDENDTVDAQSVRVVEHSTCNAINKWQPTWIRKS